MTNLKLVDNVNIERKFSNEDAIQYDEILGISVTSDDFDFFIAQLPDREKDLIDLYYREHKNQKDIAKMFGVTQGAVSSRLIRAKSRLKFLRKMPKITSEDIDRDLQIFGDLERDIIKTMMETTCQSKTAIILNKRYVWQSEKQKMTQVKVRHRFLKCLENLKNLRKEKKEFDKYYRLLDYLKKNPYKLHEVKLPHFDRGNCAIFSMNI